MLNCPCCGQPWNAPRIAVSDAAAYVDGVRIDLEPATCDVLRHLLAGRGETLSYEMIASVLTRPTRGAVAQHVHRIRNALPGIVCITTTPGVGYKLDVVAS